MLLSLRSWLKILTKHKKFNSIINQIDKILVKKKVKVVLKININVYNK